MPTYERPDAEAVKRWAGLTTEIFDRITENQLAAMITDCLQDGEDDVFLRIGESFQTKELSSPQLRVLQRAVAHRTAAVVFDGALTGRVFGTHVPTVEHENSESIQALIEYHEDRAKEKESLLKGAGEKTNTRQPFYLPRTDSGTFVVGDSDRAPSDRNVLVDERDDVSAWDTERG